MRPVRRREGRSHSRLRYHFTPKWRGDNAYATGIIISKILTRWVTVGGNLGAQSGSFVTLGRTRGGSPLCLVPQLVAHSPDGDDVLWMMRIRLNRPPQPLYASLHLLQRPAPLGVIPPHVQRNIVVADGLSNVLHQAGQDRK